MVATKYTRTIHGRRGLTNLEIGRYSSRRWYKSVSSPTYLTIPYRNVVMKCARASPIKIVTISVEDKHGRYREAYVGHT